MSSINIDCIRPNTIYASFTQQQQKREKNKNNVDFAVKTRQVK